MIKLLLALFLLDDAEDMHNICCADSNSMIMVILRPVGYMPTQHMV